MLNLMLCYEKYVNLALEQAVCTSWNSVHSVVINKQQVIWESLGLISGIINSIWEKLLSPTVDFFEERNMLYFENSSY